jgi:hypothetical protein
MRWLGGEIFGGGSPDPRVNLTGTSVTRSGTTATVTCANHGRKVGEMFNMFGGMDAAFRIVGTVTAVTTNTFTYTLDSAAGADYTGEVVIAPVICAEWGIISECQNGFDGYHVNLSCGGYKGEALVRRNGFRHKTNHNYVIAGDGTHARIIHKCYQIGDTANGFTNVAGVFIEAYHEDLLGPQVDYDSSAGFNRVQIRGYVNYSGMSVTPTGTLHAKDEVNIVIDGSSTCNTYQTPYTHW